MENFRGTISIRPFNPGKHTIEEIGNSIHYQLMNNKDYINSNIGIEMNTDEVFIWIDECEGEVPEIII